MPLLLLVGVVLNEVAEGVTAAGRMMSRAGDREKELACELGLRGLISNSGSESESESEGLGCRGEGAPCAVTFSSKLNITS